MTKKRTLDPEMIDSVAQNMFYALPLIKKRLLHMDIVQKEHGTPLSHVQVLAMLQDVGMMSVSEISRRLGIAKPNITPLIDRLIADGFVERKRDEHDRRMVIVSICQPGVARLMEIRGKMQELVGEWAVNLSAADLRELNDSLHTITRVLGSTLQHSHE